MILNNVDNRWKIIKEEHKRSPITGANELWKQQKLAQILYKQLKLFLAILYNV